MANASDLPRLVGEPQRPTREAPDLPAPQTRALAIIAQVNGARPRFFEESGLGPYSSRNVYVQALVRKGLVAINGVGVVQVTTEGRNVPVPNV